MRQGRQAHGVTKPIGAEVRFEESRGKLVPGPS